METKNKQQARQGLLAAHRDGTLQVLAEGMESTSSQLVELSAIKRKAKQELLAAYRSGDLEKIADAMEQTVAAVEQKVAVRASELSSIKQKAKSGSHFTTFIFSLFSFKSRWLYHFEISNY